MRTDNFSVNYQAAVKMFDRAAFFAFPFGHQRARVLVVLGNNTVVDGIEIILVNADCLICLRNLELRCLFE